MGRETEKNCKSKNPLSFYSIPLDRMLLCPCRKLLPSRFSSPFKQHKPNFVHISPPRPQPRRGINALTNNNNYNLDNYNNNVGHPFHRHHPRPAPPQVLQGLRQQLQVAAAPINLDQVVEEPRVGLVTPPQLGRTLMLEVSVRRLFFFFDALRRPT